MNSPVLLLGFNRPELTARVLDSIRSYRPTRLYFSVDGARDHIPSEDDRVQATRDLLASVDWNCQVKTNFSNRNLGCRAAVSQAITWFFEHEDEGIILEDDCLPNSTFFPFCNEMLSRYRNDSRVMLVTGESYGRDIASFNRFSYSFSRYALIWGWATWRRSWNLYEANMLNWPTDCDENWLERFFRRPEVANYWHTRFSMVMADPNYTWDYQWIYTCLTNTGLCIVPNSNLITNLGCGVNATHTFQENWHLSNRPTQDLQFPLRHPSKVKIDVQLDHNIELERFEIPECNDVKVTKAFDYKEAFWSIFLKYPMKILRILRGIIGKVKRGIANKIRKLRILEQDQ